MADAPGGGPGPSGAAARICRTASGSSTVAITRSRPPPCRQANTSIAKEDASYCTSYTDAADPAAAAGVGLWPRDEGTLDGGAYSHSSLSLQRHARRRPCRTRP